MTNEIAMSARVVTTINLSQDLMSAAISGDPGLLNDPELAVKCVAQSTALVNEIERKLTEGGTN